MTNIHYQHRFSETYPHAVYNREARQKKAKTIIAVLSDFFRTGYMIRPGTNRARLANSWHTMSIGYVLDIYRCCKNRLDDKKTGCSDVLSWSDIATKLEKSLLNSVRPLFFTQIVNLILPG